MANLVGDPNQPFVSSLPELDENTDAVPETWNPVHQALLNNDAMLNDSKAKLGVGNGDINKFFALPFTIDTRSQVLTYDLTSGNLVKIEEKDGASVIQTINLNYDLGSGDLVSVEAIADSLTVTTTLNYDVDGNLESTSKVVA